MGIERARVVEVHAAGSATGRVGSGYLISDRLVLTCGRVVDRRGSTDIRPVGMGGWLTAAVVWSAPGGDAAVMEVDDPSALMVSPDRIRWGHVTGGRPVPVTAMGFPPADVRPQWPRDPAQFLGQLVPGDGRRLGVTANSAGAQAGDGMSGAVLFAGAELVGVLVGGAHAVPVPALTDDPAFVEVVGEGRELEVTPVSTPAFGFPILPGGR